MIHESETFLRLIAKYFSPLALPRERAARHATRLERRRVRRNNLIRLRPVLREYIFRSAHLLTVCLLAAVVLALLLPWPLPAAVALLGFLLAFLHTVLLIFLQQWANDVAASEGRKNPEIENR